MVLLRFCSCFRGDENRQVIVFPVYIGGVRILDPQLQSGGAQVLIGDGGDGQVKELAVGRDLFDVDSWQQFCLGNVDDYSIRIDQLIMGEGGWPVAVQTDQQRVIKGIGVDTADGVRFSRHHRADGE